MHKTSTKLLITDLAVALCLQVERDAYKAECDALKRKCKELRQDLEHVMLHACKGPFGKAPMPGDVDDVGHEDKKAKSELKLCKAMTRSSMFSFSSARASPTDSRLPC